ncbi:hypothetical protein V7S57_02435 [Caulobacter sp. CCNWLY153]|uniref:hypothetical protein n=1 Tax=unclassified Caulobacter TaxID=2648921 RepID=UPI002FF38E36
MTKKPEPAAQAAGETARAAEPVRKAYLRTRHDDAWGPEGGFSDLTEEELAGAPEGLFVLATSDQLQRRRR